VTVRLKSDSVERFCCVTYAHIKSATDAAKSPCHRGQGRYLV